jgi:hypothetical protein
MNIEEARRVRTELFNNYADRFDCCESDFFQPLVEELVERAAIERTPGPRHGNGHRHRRL